MYPTGAPIQSNSLQKGRRRAPDAIIAIYSSVKVVQSEPWLVPTLIAVKFFLLATFPNSPAARIFGHQRAP